MHLRGFLCVFMMMVLTTACRKGGTDSNSSTSAGLSVTPSSTTIIAGTGGVQLNASVILGSGAVDNTASFIWESDDPNIVSVDANGFATGLSVGIAKISATSNLLTGSANVWVMSANAGAQSLTLRGDARYEDREYNLQGFTGTLTQKPIRNAVIEVVAIDGFQVIGTGATDSFGAFNLTVDNSANRAGVYLRLLSQTAANHSEKVEVRNNDIEHEILWFISAGIDDSISEPFSATQDMLATAVARIGGAFNIMDVMSDASIFVQATGLTCPEPNTTCIPPLATVYWEPGSAKGTFYDDSADAISILGGGTFGGDTDEYDDVVIAHEYAHFVISKFSRDDSPGGGHDLFDSDQDIRLSWSEGWATFFPYAVFDSPIYVDTVPGGTLISLNNEDYSGASKSGTPLSTLAIYTTSEIAVSGVLWDVIDGLDGSESDALDLSFTEVFQTVLSFPASKPTTLETFWTTFSNIQSVSDRDNFQDILKGRQISLFQDLSESAELTLTPTATQTHTLYQAGSDPAGDIDRIPFEVAMGATYTVRTFNLSGGADTFLRILGPSSELIGSNDNVNSLNYFGCGINVFTGTSSCPANNTSNLSSSVTFTAQASGTFIAEVSRSENAPPSSGLLGAYEIELTSP